MKTLALIDISVPGNWNVPLTSMPPVRWLIGVLYKYGISHNVVDTVSAWGNLDQDWLEFRCEIETSWSWCVLLPLNEQERDLCYKLLAEGKLIMQVHYIEENNVGETNYIPHR